MYQVVHTVTAAANPANTTGPTREFEGVLKVCIFVILAEKSVAMRWLSEFEVGTDLK